MRRAGQVIPVLLLIFLLSAADAAAAAATNIRVVTDPTAVETSIGHKFILRTTITNEGPSPAGNLIAHLNVLSLDGSVYIDPEDWSSNRTRYLSPISARGSVTLAWKLQAVNSGSVGVYVAVLTRRREARPPVVGPMVRVAIARRQTLNSAGILPLALGVPALLTLLTVGVRVGRRRRGT
ncbi:MAG: hypothetical protein M3R37_13425 [Actinomycetota bacterium]|nr:hypothetical protein [Actinomycetota bacterium]